MISRKSTYRLVLWAALIIGGAILLFGAVRLLGFSFDPFGWTKGKADAFESTDLARDLEGEGQAEQAIRTDTYHHSVVTIQSEAATRAAEARSLPDAETPLDPTRFDRLRSADLSVCRSAESVCPAPDPAPGG